MGKFIGREKEREKLQRALHSDNPELIVVHGRRRVGKTYLIRKEYAKNILLEVSGIHNGSYKNQLTNFHREIGKKSKKIAKKETPEDWFEAFALLSDYLDSIKITDKNVLFFDEFPWMHTHKSKFVSMFGHFWNTYCTQPGKPKLVVVICGSAASFMINKVIKNRGGLHNRVTERIPLAPFNLYETEAFLSSRRIILDRYDYLQLYMAIGGIPHYLEKIHSGDSVPAAIDRLCFKPGGILVDEFNLVFESLFKDSQNHEKIVEALAKTQKGLSREELIAKSKISSGGTFTNAIKELIESGFASEYQPYGNKKKDKLFRLTDEYSLFYLKFIKKNRDGNWLTFFHSRSYASWSGFAFENVCMKHIPQIKKGLGLSGIDTHSSSWRNEKAQIDLLIDRNDRSINICELKFSTSPFTITKKYAESLKNKKQEFVDALPKRKNVFVTMITTYGVVNNTHKMKATDNQIDMNSLFDKV